MLSENKTDCEKIQNSISIIYSPTRAHMRLCASEMGKLMTVHTPCKHGTDNTSVLGLSHEAVRNHPIQNPNLVETFGLQHVINSSVMELFHVRCFREPTAASLSESRTRSFRKKRRTSRCLTNPCGTDPISKPNRLYIFHKVLVYTL